MNKGGINKFTWGEDCIIEGCVRAENKIQVERTHMVLWGFDESCRV